MRSIHIDRAGDWNTFQIRADCGIRV